MEENKTEEAAKPVEVAEIDDDEIEDMNEDYFSMRKYLTNLETSVGIFIDFSGFNYSRKVNISSQGQLVPGNQEREDK